VGRVAVEKNIEAFLRLNVDADKIVVGDGPARRELQARYPQAQWAGVRNGADLAAFYADADVLVFPSLTDTFGLVMLEAMASGTPVAAYPVTGPRDVVVQGHNGCLDPDLREAVTGALRVDRSACRAFALANSWPVIARRMAASLNSAHRANGPAAAGQGAGGHKLPMLDRAHTMRRYESQIEAGGV